MELIIILIIIASLTGVYFIPGIVARARGHKNLTAIVTLNLLLGWTTIGWIVALIWAFRDD